MPLEIEIGIKIWSQFTLSSQKQYLNEWPCIRYTYFSVHHKLWFTTNFGLQFIRSFYSCNRQQLCSKLIYIFDGMVFSRCCRTTMHGIFSLNTIYDVSNRCIKIHFIFYKLYLYIRAIFYNLWKSAIWLTTEFQSMSCAMCKMQRKKVCTIKIKTNPQNWSQ